MKGFIRQVTQRHAIEKFLGISLCISVIRVSQTIFYMDLGAGYMMLYGTRVWEQYLPHGFLARRISTKYKPCLVIKTCLMKYRDYSVWGLYNQIDSLCTFLDFPAIFYISSEIKTCKFKCLSVKSASRQTKRKIWGTTG